MTPYATGLAALFILGIWGLVVIYRQPRPVRMALLATWLILLVITIVFYAANYFAEH